ncbi:MAG: Ku protein [Clostridiales bacterium]|jgi:DNA end-binding protein Ku|nr:Ku protein [Clostridiales bacterium]
MAVAHKGLISMGLVLIPIGMYKTSVDNDIHFNQLDKESKARIRYKKYCSHCNKEVTSDDIIKGYEYETDKYVIMTDEELEKIKTKKDRTIHIMQFANMSEIDSIYFEKDYYAIPDVGAEKAYELLRQTILQQNKIAIAKTVMGTNEKLIVLYPTNEGIIVKTLFYADEIVSVPKQIPQMQLDQNELDMAKMIIENMTKPFNIKEYNDEYQARLRSAIMTKIQGKEIVTTDTGETNNVIDLMEALQRSLELTSNNKNNNSNNNNAMAKVSGTL